MIFFIYRDLQLWSGKKATRKTKQPKHLSDSAAAKHGLNPAELTDHKIALCARLDTKNAVWQDWIEGQRGNGAAGTQSPRLDNEFYQTVDLTRAEHKLNVSIWSVQLGKVRASVVTLLVKGDSMITGGGSHTCLNEWPQLRAHAGSNFLQLKTLLSIMMRLRVRRAKEDCQMCSSSSSV